MMPGPNSKVTTRAAGKSDSDNEHASLQSLDDKLNAILNMLQKNTDDIQEIKTEQKELRTSIEFCHETVGELKHLITNQDKKINSCEQDLKRVVEDNLKVNKEIKVLRNDINTLEQYSHRNNLIIYGVPEETKENIHTVVRRLAVALQFTDWSSRLLDAVHRMGKAGETGPRPIIMKFISRLDKEEFLKKRRVRRHLRALDLGFSNENAIYVNESLTPSTRELLKLTRARAKERNYEQVWTANCSIFVRKAKGDSPAIKILSSKDLEKL